MAQVAPREMGFEQLVSVLVMEHAEIVKELAYLEKSVDERAYPSAATALQRLDRLFRQHIADEEAQVLRLLIEVYGVKGADDAIEVFRQHRPIYKLMTKVRELASLSPEELTANEARLRSMLEDHARTEEASVFPMALSAFRAEGSRSNLGKG